MSRALAAVLCLFLAACEKESTQKNIIPGYRVVETADVSFIGIRRTSARMVIPPGHTREEVTATMQHVARQIQQRTNADAVSLLAYRPQDQLNGIYTIGRTIYAPDGEWPTSASSAPKRFVTDLNDLYFDPPTRTRAIGDTVILANSLPDGVAVSDTFEIWSDEHVVIRPPNGSKAVVREVRRQAIGSVEIVRYRVTVLGRQSGTTGWVFASDTRRPR